MRENIASKTFTLFALLINVGVWEHNFHIALKILYAVFAGVVLGLSGINQWNVFRKSYPSLKVVIIIEHVVTMILPRKKNRHHNSASKIKKDVQ